MLPFAGAEALGACETARLLQRSTWRNEDFLKRGRNALLFLFICFLRLFPPSAGPSPFSLFSPIRTPGTKLAEPGLGRGRPRLKSLLSPAPLAAGLLVQPGRPSVGFAASKCALCGGLQQQAAFQRCGNPMAFQLLLPAVPMPLWSGAAASVLRETHGHRALMKSPGGAAAHDPLHPCQHNVA